MRLKHVTLYMILSLLLLSVAPLVQAQQASPEATPEAIDPFARQVQLNLTFADFNLSDLKINGKYGSASAWFPFEANWVPDQPVPVSLDYMASPLLHADSSMSVLANGEKITSFRPIADGSPHTVNFTVPITSLG